MQERQKFSAEAPFTLDVTVWWLETPHITPKVKTWWFDSAPLHGQVTFRVVYSRFGKGKARVDLAYPLGPCPIGVATLSRRDLQQVLGGVVQAALPDLKLAPWHHTCIDLEYRARDREEA